MSGKDHFEKEPFDPDVHEAFKRAVASRGSRPSIPNDAGIEAPEEIAERGRAMFRRALMQADADDLQEDLRQMLEALGMSAHARPYSPHRVFQEALNEMKRQLVAVPRSAAISEWQEISTAPVKPVEEVPGYYRFRCLLQDERGYVQEGYAMYTHAKKQLTWMGANDRKVHPVYWMPLPIARNNRVTSQPDTDAVTIVAPPIPPLLQREWMAQALFEVDAPDHREWEDVWLDERERYLRLADTAIQKATMLGLSS